MAVNDCKMQKLHRLIFLKAAKICYYLQQSEGCQHARGQPARLVPHKSHSFTRHASSRPQKDDVSACFLMKMWRNDVSNIFSGRHYYQFIWIYLSVSFLFRPISSEQLIGEMEMTQSNNDRNKFYLFLFLFY